MKAWLFAVLAAWLTLPLSARAEGKPRNARAEGEPRNAAKAWTGPRVEFSYRLYSLRDSSGGGLVQSAAFSGFLPTRAVRAGAGIEGGARRYEYGPLDGLLSGNVFIGYQHLRGVGRVVPYAVAIGELGVLLEKRYHSALVRSVRGAGLELGADVNLVRSLYVGVGLTCMLYTTGGLFYDTFGLRLSIGL